MSDDPRIDPRLVAATAAIREQENRFSLKPAVEHARQILAAADAVDPVRAEVASLRSQVATARADALNEAADEVEAKLAALPAHAQGGDYARDERLFVLRLRARAVGAE